MVLMKFLKKEAGWKVVTWKPYTEEQNYNSQITNLEKKDAFKIIGAVVGSKTDISDRSTFVQPV